MDLNYDKLARTDDGCIEEIKNELDLHCNHKVGKLIGRVLHAIRDSLSYAESAELIKHLPDNIKVIYVSDWRLNYKKKQINHLDGLIAEVIKNDQQHKDKVINNEITALKATLITLKVLDKHIHFLEFDFLKYSLKQELVEAMYEAA